MSSDEPTPRVQFARLLHTVPSKAASEATKAEPVQLVARNMPVLRRADLSPTEREIVVQLQRNGRLPFAHIARVMNSSEKTVRSIVTRLEESQVIHITALTFPDLLGFTGAATCAVKLAPGASARQVAHQLGRMDVVNYIAVTLGSVDIWADLVCRDRATLLTVLDEQVRRVEGIQSIEAFLYLNITYRSLGAAELSRPTLQGSPLSFNETDRKIFAELAHNGRESYHDIAQKLGVSESLVRQRVKRAMDAGVLSINALVNPSSLGGEVMAWVGVRTAHARAPELASALAGWPHAAYIGVTAGRYDLFVEFICHDENELLGQLTALSKHELVEDLEPFVYLDLQVKAITFA